MDAILEDMRREPVPHPAGKWLDYLALEHRATTLVWRRLVEAGAARPEPARWPRRTPGFALTGLQPTTWARHFLGSAAAMGPALPPAAVILWRALDALLPDRDLDLPAPAVERLAAAPLPATMTTLFAALDESLTRLSLHF